MAYYLKLDKAKIAGYN